MNEHYQNLSLANPEANQLNGGQKLFLAVGLTGIFILVLALLNVNFPNKALFLLTSIGCILLGVIGYARSSYKVNFPGIHNNGVYFKSSSNKGVIAWSMGIVLTALYVFLYWFPQYLGQGQNGAANTGLVGFFDPLS